MKKKILLRGFSVGLLIISMTTMAQSVGYIVPGVPKPFKFGHVAKNPHIVTNPHPPRQLYTLQPNDALRYQQQHNHYQEDLRRVAQQEQLIKDYTAEINKSRVQYSLPSFSKDVRTSYYHEAYKKLKQMNPDNFSIKDATFIVENAFYDNKLDSARFNKTISNISGFIRKAMQNQELDPKSNLSKNLSIYQFISDTLTVDGRTHLPYTYDFNDYMGKENWNNMFVSKLLYTGKGQCNSMPRLYLILAEELEANSYLALAPNHSFIRFKDGQGEWHNAELTSGAIMSDMMMFDSGFIKAETIRNGNYMTARTKRQLMSLLLDDLASGYISKFGRDEFVQTVVNSALELDPNGINPNIHNFNMKLARMTFVAQQLRAKNPKELSRHPKALEMYKELALQDMKLKELGFQEMPKERYEAWLESLNKEKEKQDQEKYKGLNKAPIIKD
ncbi:conserved exported protein of unknown function [Tenacibaculum sp. 190130A14a]|uniref:Protein SirB1 N-terminal domain-containing protein n=1 Tax=Tenacibaculum polynesiense TaxID=3137857 RepID=A0ABM9PEV1_9FLAO